MKFHFFLMLGILSAARAIWCVGFSKRWTDRAKRDLQDEMGRGPSDDYVVEQARRFIVVMWVGLAAYSSFMANSQL